MLFYFGKTFTASASGERLREVKCDKCRTIFFYRLCRVGSAKGSAPYYIGQASAQRRATEGAQKALAKRLDREVEMVPCPKCHWVNQGLVETYRKTRYRQVWAAGWAFAAIGLIVLPLVLAMSNPRWDSAAVQTGLILAVAILGLIPAAWWIQRQLRLRIDPNLTYPRQPVRPPGTPPALVTRRDPVSHDEYLTPARAAGDPVPPHWLEFRPGGLVLPQLCCQCLGPAETTFAMPFRLNDEVELAAPLCHGCRAGLRRTWFLRMARWLLLAPTCCLPAFLVPGIDEIGHWMLFVLASGVVFVGGILLMALRHRPYRLKTLDADRGIGGIHMQNPKYHAKLAAFLRQRDLAPDDSAERVRQSVDSGRAEMF